MGAPQSKLCAAAAAGDVAVIRALVAGGTPVEQVDGTSYGWRAVHYAAYHNKPAAVAVLASLGADVNAKSPTGMFSGGKTALVVAAERSNVSVIPALLAAGANVHMADQSDWTPLHYAVAAGSADCVAELLAGHATPDATTGRGVTPLALAVTGGHLPLVRLLVPAAAAANVVACFDEAADASRDTMLAVLATSPAVTERHLRAAMVRLEAAAARATADAATHKRLADELARDLAALRAAASELPAVSAPLAARIKEADAQLAAERNAQTEGHAAAHVVQRTVAQLTALLASRSTAPAPAAAATPGISTAAAAVAAAAADAAASVSDNLLDWVSSLLWSSPAPAGSGGASATSGGGGGSGGASATTASAASGGSGGAAAAAATDAMAAARVAVPSAPPTLPPPTAPRAGAAAGTDDSDNLCSICWSEPKNAASVPCGHMMCYNCAQRCQAASGTCPHCRTHMTSVLKLFG